MKKSNTLFSCLIIFGLVFTLNTYAQMKGDGNVITRTIELSSFHSLDIGGSFNIYFTQADEQKVEIETDANLMDRITLDVSDGTLNISSKPIKKYTKLNISLQAPTLEDLNIHGASEFSTRGVLKGDKLTVNSSGASSAELYINVGELHTVSSGASNIHYTGIARLHQVNASGASEVDAGDLETETADVEASGASSVSIDVDQDLTLNTSGAADVDYNDVAEITYKNKNDIVVIQDRDEDSYVIYTDDDDEKVKVNALGIVHVVEDDDTTEVIIGRHKLIIDEDGEVRYKKYRRNKFNGHWAGVDLGVNGYVTPDFNMKFKPEDRYIDLRMEKSIFVGINFFEQNISLSRNQKWGLITGLGWEAHNYRFKDNVMITNDSITLKGFYSSGISMRKSKLVVNYLTIPLLFEFQTNRYIKKNSFHITVGVIGGVRLWSHTKRYFEETNKAYELLDPVTGDKVLDAISPGNKKVKNWDGYHLNPFKADVTFRIGWGWINLFGNYSVTTLFRKDRGPELYPFSAGITLVGW